MTVEIQVIEQNDEKLFKCEDAGTTVLFKTLDAYCFGMGNIEVTKNGEQFPLKSQCAAYIGSTGGMAAAYQFHFLSQCFAEASKATAKAEQLEANDMITGLNFSIKSPGIKNNADFIETVRNYPLAYNPI